MTTIDFDPVSEAHRQNPFPAYERLRRHAPVFALEKSTPFPNGAYAVASYDDVVYVLRHPEIFSSHAMMTMSNAITSGVAGANLSPAEAARIAEHVRAMPFQGPELTTARSLIGSDPPVHGPMRGLVNRGFTPRRISALEPRIRAIARASLDALEGKREVEIVHDFFIPLPVTVIAELLGVEPERSADFKRWSDCAVAASTAGAGGLGFEKVIAGIAELTRYIAEVVERRRRAPGDDLISVLIRAEDGETALRPVEVAMFTLLLLVAGNETTTNLLGNTILALMEHPDELARVRRDPRRIPALVEEGLRYDGPIQYLFRNATQDVELSGVKIQAGAMVLPLIGSANRDERQFADAARFDPSRSTQGHVAFGLGNHFCLGASLARLEARVALEELLPRYSGFEQIEPHVDYVDSYVVRGPKRLPLRVEASPADH